MLRKLMLIALCIPIVFVAANIIGPDRPLLAQNDTAGFKTQVFVLGTGKIVLPDGASKGYGGGASLMFGVQPTPHLIGWTKVTEHKIINKNTETKTEADEIKGGVMFVFPDVWPAVRMSVYANLGIGGAKLEYPEYTEEIDWSKVAGGGLFFALTKKYKAWAGLDWESTENINITSITLGLSTNF